jgi:hypothetical protein
LSTTLEEISEYRVEYVGGGKTSYDYRALIGLYRANGSIMGAAYFHRDPATMPATDSKDANGYVHCNYLSEDYPRIIDLLRNEKPVYLRYVPGKWNIGSITTSLEPAGESELAT